MNDEDQFRLMITGFAIVIVGLILWSLIIEAHLVCSDRIPENMELKYGIENYHPPGVKCIFESKAEDDYLEIKTIYKQTKNHGWIEE